MVDKILVDGTQGVLVATHLPETQWHKPLMALDVPQYRNKDFFKETAQHKVPIHWDAAKTTSSRNAKKQTMIYRNRGNFGHAKRHWVSSDNRHGAMTRTARKQRRRTPEVLLGTQRAGRAGGRRIAGRECKGGRREPPVRMKSRVPCGR